MTIEPRVVHCKREPYDVLIDRTTRYGNPYPISKNRTREQAIEQFREYLYRNPKLVEQVKRELRGKVLGCWCAPKACHGDILLAVANEQPKAAFDD